MTDIDDTAGAFVKSSYSGTGNCVEVAIADSTVFVRDSKHRDELWLQFTFSEWEAFLLGAKNEEFDLT